MDDLRIPSRSKDLLVLLAELAKDSPELRVRICRYADGKVKEYENTDERLQKEYDELTDSDRAEFENLEYVGKQINKVERNERMWHELWMELRPL